MAQKQAVWRERQTQAQIMLLAVMALVPAPAQTPTPAPTQAPNPIPRRILIANGTTLQKSGLKLNSNRVQHHAVHNTMLGLETSTLSFWISIAWHGISEEASCLISISEF